jgi:hypothetical protein
MAITVKRNSADIARARRLHNASKNFVVIIFDTASAPFFRFLAGSLHPFPSGSICTAQIKISVDTIAASLISIRRHAIALGTAANYCDSIFPSTSNITPPVLVHHPVHLVTQYLRLFRRRILPEQK